MDISFKSIAFELKYASNQIDSVYAALCILNSGDQKIPTNILNLYKGYLPEDFRAYLSKYKDTPDSPVNIVFEHHKLPSNEQHNDWDLIEYN
jgi:hypothetical protein